LLKVENLNLILFQNSPKQQSHTWPQGCHLKGRRRPPLLQGRCGILIFQTYPKTFFDDILNDISTNRNYLIINLNFKTTEARPLQEACPLQKARALQEGRQKVPFNFLRKK
jgi:hypothetical protein